MAAMFSISDSESDSEEVKEKENNQPSTVEEQHTPRHTLTLPELRLTGRKPQRNPWKEENKRNNTE